MKYILQIFNDYQQIIIIISIVSVVIFILSMAFVPILIKRIPADYFVNPIYHKIKINTFYSLIIFILKNTFGLIFVLAGIIMLVTPGQGIFSIIIGLSLMQFKGKQKLEYKLVKNNLTFKALNWLRAKTKSKDFIR